MTKGYLPYVLTGILGALLFLPFLGQVHLFDWDEINFAEIAREMLVTGNYTQPQINYEPFWEKPPLFIWLQALCMNLFGVGAFGARLPNALVGILTLVGIFHLGKQHFGPRFGWLWVLVWVGSFLPHFYFKSGIIDPLFNLLIFLGVYDVFHASYYYRQEQKRVWSSTLLSPVFIGLAVLTKGPVAFLLYGLCIAVFWLLNRARPILSWQQFVLMILVGFVVVAAWFGLEMVQHGTWFMEEFIAYQVRLLTTEDAGHGGPFYYHVVVLVVGCFPASIFLLAAFKRQVEDDPMQRQLKHWMIVLLSVVLAVFSIVDTKIVHYSSLVYFPLTFLAAYGLHHLTEGRMKWRVWGSWLGGFVGGLIGLALTIVPWVGIMKEAIIPLIKDPFAVANLQADVVWTGWESGIGLLCLVGVIWGMVSLARQRFWRGAVVLFGSMVVVIQLALLVVVPKIEGYSQRAAISFLEEHQGEEAYVAVLGYKSYAHLFYGRMRLPDDAGTGVGLLRPPKGKGTDWLLHGAIDKPVYFITRMDRVDRLQLPPDVKKIGEENGFVFLRREAGEGYGR